MGRLSIQKSQQITNSSNHFIFHLLVTALLLFSRPSFVLAQHLGHLNRVSRAWQIGPNSYHFSMAVDLEPPLPPDLLRFAHSCLRIYFNPVRSNRLPSTIVSI